MIGAVTDRLSVFAVLFAGLAVILGGCGGGRRSDDERYASSVCNAISSWENAMDEGVFKPLKRTRPASGHRTEATVTRMIAKTQRFTQELLVKSTRLDPPSGSAQHAKVALVTVVSGVDKDLHKLQTSVEKDYGKSPNEPSLRRNARALADLKYLKTGLASAWGQVDTVINAMVYVAPSMGHSFADADACSGLSKP
jgi:hypothetical protein